jgi:proton-translocating NADH-quinone oxidoreductase chain L
MLLFVFLPLINFIFIGLLGRYLTRHILIHFSLYLLIIMGCGNLIIYYFALKFNLHFYVHIGMWLNIDLFDLAWEFWFDPFTLIILVIVSFISVLVHIYSFMYIKFDPHLHRFISYLSLFTFFIFILVSAANLVQLFVGWEGVGLCSYLLINFWTTRLQANKAAIKAVVINRIGDISLLLAIGLIFWIFKTSDLILLQVLIPVIHDLMIMGYEYEIYGRVIFYLDIVCFFVFIGVIGKSAQMGLHTWLPAAIEGPTPVSALIHAATIVTAGIFLILRLAFFFECSSVLQNVIIIVGLLTALLSALTAVFLFDIKRIIAYSTCSQLGFIVLACGLSQYQIAFFHLINHAFFKALLFLTAGLIIHIMHNEQDIRRLDWLFNQSPFIYILILIGNIAIIGLPFLAGYYSKDLIIEFTYIATTGIYQSIIFGAPLIFFIILIATILTAVYSARLYYYLFVRGGRVISDSHLLAQNTHVRWPIVVLSIGSIFCGYLFNDVFSIFNWPLALGSNSPRYFVFDNEILPWYIKLAPLFVNSFILIIFMLVIIILHCYDFSLTKLSVVLKPLSTSHYFFIKLRITIITMAHNNYYYNELYNYISLVSYYYFYHHVFVNIDKGIIEIIGPQGISYFYYKLATFFHQLYQQNLKMHLFFIYNSIIIYIGIVNLYL